ncbi:MAG: serine/threonine-protein phosphatase [Candidatus Aminicenantes bacterium]|nr:serine/threonine-protein phosphatase [Candidatus Aminicenantes bacterium]
MDSKNHKNKNSGIWETFKTDFKESEITREVKYDLTDTLDFYLTEDQKTRMKEMGWFKKLIFIPAWLLRIMFFKLTRIRRLLLALALILSVVSINNNNSSNNSFLGLIILLFILILELKDKLIAVDELSAGRAVQTAFMPPENPDIPGWSLWLYSRPANSVGGDMVDLIPIDEINYGVVLGDVSGKELGAALYMVKLQSTLRALASDFASLSNLGSKINKIFHRDSESNRFATMVYISLKKNQGNLKVLNAGHIPPILLSNGELVEMAKGSPAIGIKSTSSYREDSLKLKKGDYLIVYSDGVSEAINSEGEFYGAGRFKDTLIAGKDLPPREMGKNIIAAVNNFVGNNKFYDDLSIVILKRD